MGDHAPPLSPIVIKSRDLGADYSQKSQQCPNSAQLAAIPCPGNHCICSYQLQQAPLPKRAETMGMDLMFGWMNKTAPRRMSDMSGACDGGVMKTRGLLAGTRIATVMGWRAVESLAPGDMVLTFDNGLQHLVDVRRETFWVADMMAPALFSAVFVPAGALGNSTDLELLPDQGVLIESDAACDALGDPFAVVPAKALDGLRGITRIAPRTQVEVITLVFANEQVIYAEGGALIHCPRTHLRLDELGRDIRGYDLVPASEAALLIECMIVEHHMVA
jgi:hypothetical protein